MATTAQTRRSRSGGEVKTLSSYLNNLPLILSGIVAFSAAIYLAFLYVLAHR